MRRFRQIAGVVLTVLALGYFVHFVVRTLRSADLGTLASAPALAALGLVALASVASILLTGWAWGHLLGSEALPTRELVAILGRTQIAKYLPGNVGHYVTRGALAVERGMPFRAVARTLTLESLLLASTAPGLTLLALPWLRPTWRRAVLAYAINFLLLGGALALLGRAVADLSLQSLPRVVGAFAISWVAGFVVPGAPAGLGVREGILLSLLPLPPTQALPVVLGFRIGTTIGDLLSLAVGTVLDNAHDQVSTVKDVGET